MLKNLCKISFAKPLKENLALQNYNKYILGPGSNLSWVFILNFKMKLRLRSDIDFTLGF